MHASSELAQLYQTETSVELKKSILQAMFVGGDSDKLIELAKNEKDPELRKTAIRNLGLMKRPGTTEALDRRSTRPTRRSTSRRRSSTRCSSRATRPGWSTLARAEKNVELKKEIVSKLSNMKSKEATDYLMELLEVSGFRVQGSGFRVRFGFWFRVLGSAVLGSAFAF